MQTISSLKELDEKVQRAAEELNMAINKASHAGLLCEIDVGEMQIIGCPPIYQIKATVKAPMALLDSLE